MKQRNRPLGQSIARNRQPRRGRRWPAAGPLSPPGPGAGGTTYRRSGGQKRSVMAASKASSVCREKHRRTRVVAVRMTVDCCSPAAHAAVGGWDGAEPSSCTSVTPRASPVRRIVSMQVVHSGCRNERLPRRYRPRGRSQAAYLRPRYESWRAQLLCWLPGEQAAGVSRRLRNAGFALAQPLLRWPQSWWLGFRFRQAVRLVRELPPGRCLPGCTAGQKPGRPRWPGLASLRSVQSSV